MARTLSDVPLADARGMLIDGDRLCSAWPSSPELSACWRSAGPNTSIGTELSNTVRFCKREPNTVTASSASAGVTDSTACAGPMAQAVTAMAWTTARTGPPKSRV